MSERKYSFSEIESMRQAISWSYPCNVPFYPEQRTKEIEERVRTLIVGGVDPHEVIEQCRAQFAQQQKAEAEWQRRATAGADASRNKEAT